jgi:cell division protein FtsW (lipid II flippase)
MFYMLSAAFSTKSKSNRFGFLLLSIAAAIFLMREASITVKLAFIIAFMLFMVLRSSKFFMLIILTFAVLPLLPLFNDGIYSGFVELLKNEAYRLDIWNSVITMLGSFGFIGIGNAPNAFKEIYSTFYVGNPSTVPHAHSLIFQLSISLGFIGILLFLMIVFFIAQGAFSYGRNCTDKKSKNRLFCYSALCSVCAMVIIGFGEHLWYNPRMGLLFWLVCGMSVCARRSANDLSASSEIMIELEENYNG